ncbi:NAD(+) diphosphatase [Sphingobium subterraneum]|uniref:NAD(+) diphosphatase n=1 Tax=Sphingobium subterraneum TaxID=627688 RepID=A0A841J036_9SPHN|nr:NAD(+) diphosphatase [Sphingobium subterraneum]MBB6124207.1 NAD+ diphosphatase [Sphingobium subterraneum]
MKRQSLPGFAAPSIDRADHVRTDPAAIARAFAHPEAARLVLRGLDPVLWGDMLEREPLPAGARMDDYVLLGLEGAEAPLFVQLSADIPHGVTQSQGVWDAADVLRAEELALYGGARSLLDWHARHGFCAVCGTPTVPAKAGWSRHCGQCGAEHFPRVDPVTIMLAECEGEILLGRQHRWPQGRYSALAGFIEPGETVEGAVARELFEEAGVVATDVRYVMSQPWPFPSSLMIACIAQVPDKRLKLDATEIEDAFWIDAAGVRTAFEGSPDARFLFPREMTVAHHLLLHWLTEQEA